MPVIYVDSSDDYDFEDCDCESCGKKFYVRPSLYKPHTEREMPTECMRCQQGLPPTYEY